MFKGYGESQSLGHTGKDWSFCSWFVLNCNKCEWKMSPPCQHWKWNKASYCHVFVKQSKFAWHLALTSVVPSNGRRQSSPLRLVILCPSTLGHLRGLHALRSIRKLTSMGCWVASFSVRPKSTTPAMAPLWLRGELKKVRSSGAAQLPKRMISRQPSVASSRLGWWPCRHYRECPHLCFCPWILELFFDTYPSHPQSYKVLCVSNSQESQYSFLIIAILRSLQYYCSYYVWLQKPRLLPFGSPPALHIPGHAEFELSKAQIFENRIKNCI